MKYPRDTCGVGYINNSFLDAYTLLRGLEHRGEETTGIAGLNEGNIKVVRWLGKIYKKNFEEYEALESEFKDYNKFLVHTRYATQGSKEKLLRDAHPITINGNFNLEGETFYSQDSDSAIVHNGQLVNIDALKEQFDNRITSSDTELLLRVYKKGGIEEVMENIPSAYSAIIADGNQVIGFRDPYGVRPLWCGEKNDSPILCSEDFPIKKTGGIPIKEIKPGEVVYIEDGEMSFETIAKPKEKFCFLEYNYFADPNSQFKGKEVWSVRKNLGRRLAQEVEIKDADFVMPVPNTGRPYAIGFQEELGIPYLPELMKVKSERSFIQSTKKDRKNSIKGNLFLGNPKVIKDRNVIVIDDSVIRGNVLETVITMLKNAGAKKIYYLSGTPPIGTDENCYCCYGIDMPSADEFLMKKFGSKESASKHFCEKYNLPFELHYISEEGLFDVLGDKKNYCTRCITGECPMGD